MNDIFGGVLQSLKQINTGAVLFDIVLTAVVSVALGLLITLFYAYMNRKKGFTIEFAVTLISICSVIALIIAVIGTNIASAFSLAGIMSVVRFRSMGQKTSDIAFIFISMATGLTVGLGLIVPALAFVVVVGVLLNLIVYLAARVKPETRLLKICVPESMSFAGQFDDIFKKYALTYDLKRVRLISSGTIMELAYTVTLSDLAKAEALMGEVRERNRNFNVTLMYEADEVE